MPWLSVLLCLALLWGCTKEEPPPPVPPPPEDLSTWTVPELVQPLRPPDPVVPVVEDKPNPAEKVYEFAPGGPIRRPSRSGPHWTFSLSGAKRSAITLVETPNPSPKANRPTAGK